MAEPRRSSQRVGWLELFFDLVFVVVVAQLTEHLEGEPSFLGVLAVAGLFVAVWSSWNNTTLLSNAAGGIPRAYRPLIFVAMAGVGVLAVSIPTISGGGQAVFAIGYAISRLAVWPLWVRERRREGRGILRPTLFGPVAAAFWLASIALPDPWRLVLWGALLAYEIITVFLGLPTSPLDPGHMLERVGLFVMIVLGESVLELVRAIAERPDALTWLVGGLAFAIVCALWWRYFELTGDVRGRIADGASGRQFRDVLVIGHYALVLALILLAAGLGAAIRHADAASTAPGILVVLSVGMALNQLSGAYMSARFTGGWRAGLVLAAPTVVAIGLLLALGSRWPEWIVVAVVLADALLQIALAIAVHCAREPRATTPPSPATGSARRS